MKNSKKNNIDFENLSAYLDDELRPEEKAQLEARLSQDAGLRQMLRDLNTTRTVLRSAPQVRRPRSFVLTPEMVQQQRFAFWAMRFSRMVAAAAAVLFAFVFAGQVYFGGAVGLSAANLEADSMTAQDNAAAEDMASAADEDEIAEMAPMAAEMEEPAEDTAAMADEPVLDTPEFGMEQTSPADAAAGGMPETPTPSMTEDATENQNAESAADAADAEVAEEPADTTDSTDDTVMTEPRDTDSERSAEPSDEAPMMMVIPTEMADGAMKDSGGGLEETQPAMAEEPEPVSFWQTISTATLIQGGLLVLAVLAGVFSVYFQRKLK